MSRVRRRCAATLAVVPLVLVALSSPAYAHKRVDEYAASTESAITAAPHLPGIEWTVHAGGLLVEVDNRSDADLTVVGYDGEPYLRVGPDGVFENRRSPTAYLNADRYGDVAVPPVADAAAPAEWVRADDGSRAVWHDHRLHWMAPEPPARALAEPDREHHLADWSLPFVHGDRRHALEGTLLWVPAPSPLPFVVAGLLLTAPAAAGFWRARAAGASRAGSRLLRPAAAVVGLVGLANMAHLPDEVLAQPQPALDVAFGLLHTSLFVGAGLAGAAVAWWNRGPTRAALGIGSAALLFHQGLLHLPALTAPVLPTSLPDAAFRLLVASSLAQAIPVAAALLAASGPHRNAPGRYRSRAIRPLGPGTDAPAPSPARSLTSNQAPCAREGPTVNSQHGGVHRESEDSARARRRPCPDAGRVWGR